MRSKDVRRVMAAGGVVLGLAALPAPAGPAAIVTALDLLGHPFPKVRQTVAERLYHVLLAGVDFPWAPAGSSDAAAGKLMGTPWNGEWRDVVPARDGCRQRRLGRGSARSGGSCSQRRERKLLGTRERCRLLIVSGTLHEDGAVRQKEREG